MTNYYIEKDGKIIFVDTDLQRLTNSITGNADYESLEIQETERPIVNFEFADTPEYIAEELAKAKEAKYTEANDKAKEYLGSGNALYELSKTQHIEATSENIGKLGARALGFITGIYQSTDTIEWTTKEDELLNLSQEQLGQVLQGLGVVQSEVWNKKYLDYIKQITDATTIENINNIVVDYTNEETTNG